MFRAIAGIAIVTVMCVLSPERESQNDSGGTQVWSPKSLSASLDALGGAAANSQLSRSLDSAGKQALAAAADAVLREAAHAHVDGVRKIATTGALEMPPLRR
jgi:hypothetical protein